MKRILIILLLMGVATIWSQVETIYPSQVRVTPRKFLVHQETDMRRFICDNPSLQDRIKRKVCIYDFITPTNRPQRPREFKVDGGMGLEAVLKGLNATSGYRQMRIFKENCIVQAKLTSDGFRNPENLVIEPGDLIVMTYGDIP